MRAFALDLRTNAIRAKTRSAIPAVAPIAIPAMAPGDRLVEPPPPDPPVTAGLRPDPDTLGRTPWGAVLTVLVVKSPGVDGTPGAIVGGIVGAVGLTVLEQDIVTAEGTSVTPTESQSCRNQSANAVPAALVNLKPTPVRIEMAEARSDAGQASATQHPILVTSPLFEQIHAVSVDAQGTP